MKKKKNSQLEGEAREKEADLLPSIKSLCAAIFFCLSSTGAEARSGDPALHLFTFCLHAWLLPDTRIRLNF